MDIFECAHDVEKKSRFTVKRFFPGTHKIAGDYRLGHWLPFEKYIVRGSFRVTNTFTIKHFYTLKYARLLWYHSPEKYHYLYKIGNPIFYLLSKNIDMNSEEAKQLIAEHVKLKMKGKIA